MLYPQGRGVIAYPDVVYAVHPPTLDPEIPESVPSHDASHALPMDKR